MNKITIKHIKLTTLYIIIFVVMISVSNLSYAQYVTYNPVEEDDYIAMLSDEDLLISSGYMIISKTITNGKKCLLEIFGDGTILFNEYLNNKYIYDELSAEGVNWDNFEPGTLAYQDYTGREIGEYLRCYYMLDNKNIRELFVDISSTEIFEEEFIPIVSGQGENVHVGIYIGGYERKIRWCKHDLFEEEDYPYLVSKIEDIIDLIKTEGVSISPEEMIDIKDEYNSVYPFDKHAKVYFIEDWAHLADEAVD